MNSVNQPETMQSSEEISQINSALTHCTQLKSQLHSTLLHIQRLNSKYNQTDYMAVIHNMENYRRNASMTSSPYPKFGARDHSAERSTSTPVRRPTMYRRMQSQNGLTSTPNHSKLLQLDDSFDSDLNDFDTPKRSMREMKKNNNTVSVRTIKVQRNLEAIITHLQVMQKSHIKRQRQLLEQSLYQSCNSSVASPGQFNRSHMDQSFGSFVTAFGSSDSLHEHSNYHTPNKHDEDKKTLDRVQRFYATPLQRMHKRLIHLNASLVSTC